MANGLPVRFHDPSPERLVPEEQKEEVPIREIGRVPIESMNALGDPQQRVGICVASSPKEHA